ncbi:MAG: hypothetical protein ACREXT_08420 [Gammaproteobacteria bacterium]
MKIDFDDGDAGFFEARAVHLVVRAAREAESHVDALPLLDFLQESAATHLARPEFGALRDRHGISGARWPSFSVWKNFRRRLFGPSPRESILSQQRSDALERAERAEHSAFEALAETARVERELVVARTEATRLQQEIHRLERDLTGLGERLLGN